MRFLSLSSALGATLAFALIYAHIFFFSGFGAESWSGWYGFLFKTLVISTLVTVICMIAYGLEILLSMTISIRTGIIFYLFIGMITGASLSLFYLPYDEFVYFLITATVLTTVGSILFYFVKTFVDSASVKIILSFSPVVMIFLLYVLVR